MAEETQGRKKESEEPQQIVKKGEMRTRRE